MSIISAIAFILRIKKCAEFLALRTENLIILFQELFHLVRRILWENCRFEVEAVETYDELTEKRRLLPRFPYLVRIILRENRRFEVEVVETYDELTEKRRLLPRFPYLVRRILRENCCSSTRSNRNLLRALVENGNYHQNYPTQISQPSRNAQYLERDTSGRRDT